MNLALLAREIRRARSHALRCVPFAAVLFCSAAAQSTSEAPPATSASSAPVELDAFSVKATRPNEYLASEQATGTRYAVPVREIPFPVSVVTNELMRDLHAWTFDDAVAYTSSFSLTSGTGNFILRGIRQANSGYRNGVRDNGIVGAAFIDRIEIVKGANAAIYGQTEPSGLRNIVTLRPRAGREFVARATVGTGDYLRGSASANDSFAGGKLLARVDGYHERTRQRQAQFADNEMTGGYAAMEYKFAPTSTLFVSAERTRSDVNDVLEQPILLDPAAGIPLGFIGQARVPGFEQFAGVNLAGPDSYNRINASTFDATWSHRINRALSLRVLATYWERDQSIASFNFSGGGVFNIVTRRNQDTRAAFVDRSIQQNLITQADLLGEFTLGPTRHKLLVTFDRQAFRIDQTTLGRALPAISIDAPDFARPPFVLDRTVYPITDTNSIQRSVTQGVLVSERVALWRDRVHVYAGGRYDEIEVESFQRTATPATRTQLPKADALTFQTGGIVRANDALSFYANYSESFTPQSVRRIPVDVNNRPLENQEGEGVEFGIKAALLGGRLTFTAGYFDLRKSNLPRAATSDTGQILTIPGTLTPYSVSGDQRSDGWEIDASWRVADTTQFTLGYGENDARWTRVPDQRHLPAAGSLLGSRPDGAPKRNLGLTGRHAFTSGTLKGFDVRAGVRHQASAIVSNSFRSPAGAIVFLYNPSFTVWDFGAGYVWSEARRRHRLDLNVRNAFDAVYHRLRTQEFGREFFLSYELTFR